MACATLDMNFWLLLHLISYDYYSCSLYLGLKELFDFPLSY